MKPLHMPWTADRTHVIASNGLTVAEIHHHCDELEGYPARDSMRWHAAFIASAPEVSAERDALKVQNNRILEVLSEKQKWLMQIEEELRETKLALKDANDFIAASSNNGRASEGRTT